MKYSSRFFLYAPFALLLILAALVALHWWRAASALEAKLAALKGREAIAGVTLDWSRATVSGFPFRLDAVFDGFSARGAGPHGPFSWSSDRFAVHALTYGAQKDVFEAAGNQRLTWTGADGAAHDFAFLPGSLRASAVRNESGLVRFDLDIAELSGKGLAIGRAQFHMRRDPDGKSIDLMAEAEMARGDLGDFGTELKSLRLYQTLSQGEAFAGLLRGEKSASESHALWRQAGGENKITQLQITGTGGATPQQRAAAAVLLGPLY